MGNHSTVLLATQFWELYSIVNEKNNTLEEVWVDSELGLSFKRTFDNELFQKWLELEEMVKKVQFRNDFNALVWQYEKSSI